MVFVHFLAVAACLGAWVLLGFLDERLSSPYLRFWLRGIRGGVMALFCCSFLAVVLAHSPLVVIPEDSRSLVFVALILALGMIGVPVGFLGGLARGRQAGSDEE